MDLFYETFYGTQSIGQLTTCKRKRKILGDEKENPNELAQRIQQIQIDVKTIPIDVEISDGCQL